MGYLIAKCRFCKTKYIFQVSSIITTSIYALAPLITKQVCNGLLLNKMLIIIIMPNKLQLKNY